MTTYVLVQANASQAAPGTVQGGAAGSNLPPGSQAASVAGGAGGVLNAPQNGALQWLITGSGTVAATLQAVASNDGVNWDTVAAAASLSGTGAASAMQVVTVPAAYFSGYVVSISGTGASAKGTLNI